MRLTEEPLRSTGKRQPVMSGPGGEDIGNIDPRKRSPSHRIEAHVDVQQSGHTLTGRWWLNDRAIRWRLLRRMRLENGSNNKEQCSHAKRGDLKRQFTSKGFNTEEDEDRGGYHFDYTVNT